MPSNVPYNTKAAQDSDEYAKKNPNVSLSDAKEGFFGALKQLMGKGQDGPQHVKGIPDTRLQDIPHQDARAPYKLDEPEMSKPPVIMPQMEPTGKLNPYQLAEMKQKMAAGESLPPGVIDQILAKDELDKQADREALERMSR